MTTRQKCKKIMNKVCFDKCGLGLDDLPDLPCVMYALDDMEEVLEELGEADSMTEILNIAKDAVDELLAEEGFNLLELE